MAKVEIYTSMFCGYCFRAKKLLQEKGVRFEETDVMAEPDQRAVMRDRAGGSNSVPQIFINGRHIGGSDALIALEARGELDALLAEAS